MSSYAQKHTVLPAPAENKFEIPLIRMIGKVQVEITNNLDKSITVNQLDIMNLRKGSLPIWLLPWGNENYLEFKDNKDLEEPLAPSFPKDANPPVVSLEDLYTESIKPGDNEKKYKPNMWTARTVVNELIFATFLRPMRPSERTAVASTSV